MDPLDWLIVEGAPIAGVAAFVLLLIAFVVYLIRSGAVWPAAARRLGLTRVREARGSQMASHRASVTERLSGDLDGVSVTIVHEWERSGRRTRNHTTATARSPHPIAARFSMHIARGGPGPSTYHVVPTGDAAFDGRVTVKSEAPEWTRALLTGPVRDAISSASLGEAVLVYDEGEVRLTYPSAPLRARDIEAALRVVTRAALVSL